MLSAIAQFPQEVSPAHGLSFFWIHAPESAPEFVAAVLADINMCTQRCTIAWPGTTKETAHDQIVSLKGVIGMATGSQVLCAACDALAVDLERGVDRTALAARYKAIASQFVGLIEEFADRIAGLTPTGQDSEF